MRVAMMPMVVAGVMGRIGQCLVGGEAEGRRARDLADAIAMFSDEIAGEQYDRDSDNDFDECDHDVSPIRDISPAH